MRGYAIIGLTNPKSEPNVSGAMRAAACYGADAVFILGERYKRMRTDTLKAYRHIPVVQVDDFEARNPVDCEMVAIEFVDSAHPLNNFKHPERAMYIFGPEDGSVDPNTMAKCKHRVFVPTKFCMNLAATVNVVLYDRMAKRGIL